MGVSFFRVVSRAKSSGSPFLLKADKILGNVQMSALFTGSLAFLCIPQCKGASGTPPAQSITRGELA